jgi:xanthine dehydrogenase YagS FAD-binding subunit
MNDFDYHGATGLADALQHGAQNGSAYIGGGTNLIDLMKAGVASPARLIDLNRLGRTDGLADIVALADGGVRIGALARNSDIANHALIRQRYPLLSQALLAGASGQLRNQATAGGNLLQRTRCYYFYDTGFEACNKRAPGSGCAAREGFNRIHAILGASDACVATNPSDMSVALAALRATVRVRGLQGERVIAFGDFHRLPGDTPYLDSNLGQGEMITAIDLPPSPFAANCRYLKVRDRASYAFALVSVAAAVALRDGVVGDAALALGGVAHKPWRVPAAEQALIGRRLDDGAIQGAAGLALAGALPLKHNAFKIELARRAMARALKTAGGVA